MEMPPAKSAVLPSIVELVTERKPEPEVPMPPTHEVFNQSPPLTGYDVAGDGALAPFAGEDPPGHRDFEPDLVAAHAASPWCRPILSIMPTLDERRATLHRR